MIKKVMYDIIFYFLESEGYVNGTNKEIICYGIKRLIYVIEDILFSLFCSALLGKMHIGIIYEVAYIIVRIYAGGFHAPQLYQCNILSFGSIIINMILIYYSTLNIMIINCIGIIFAIYISIRAPIESPKKKLSIYEKKIYKKKMIVYVTIELIIMLLFNYIGEITCAKAICSAMGLVVFGLLFKQQG